MCTYVRVKIERRREREGREKKENKTDRKKKRERVTDREGEKKNEYNITYFFTPSYWKYSSV